MKRVPTLLLTALFLPGCGGWMIEDVRPLEEAAHAAPPELVAAVHETPPDADETVIVDGRLWVPWGPAVEMAPTGLRSVGSTHGITIHARAWDRSPFDDLFVADGDLWQGYAPVIGRSNAGAAAGH